MEGGSVTDPDFLEDPAKLFRGSSASIRLDDPEKLFQESIEQSFAWWRPKARLRLDPTPCISDLASHRWHRPRLSPDEEIDAVRRIQAADICGPLRFARFDDFAKLLAGFHGKVLQVANSHIPKRWRRRLPLRDKHTNNLFFEDLVAAGVAAMWKAALKFDVAAGYRFWTGVRAPVLGAISDEARIWRRHGSGETRLDRWLYTHPQASEEQVLRAQERLHKVEERLARWLCEHPAASLQEILKEWERIHKRLPFHSLQEAAEGIKLFWTWGSDFDYSVEADETFEAGVASYFAGSCFNQFTLAPQLRIHERFSLLIDRLSGGLDTGSDVGEVRRPKAPEDLDDYNESAVVQFKNGKRQVTRQKAASYCYGIVVSAELRARATENLEFAKRRWERRIWRAPLPAQTYARWSTKFGLGRLEHENRQIVPAYVPVTRFKWEVEYWGAEGNVLSILESPSRHCLKPRPCAICSRSSANNVPRLSVSLSAA